MSDTKQLNKFQLFLKEYVPYIAIIILVLLIKRFVVSPIKVNGNSMVDTLHDGDIMLLNIIGYRLSGVERFDIVVCDTDKEYIIKRVIGLPGETIEYRDNQLYVNGKKVSGGKFTPTTNGTYNVSVEITENDYYTNATNETTFKVKVTSTIIANPVTTTYNVDKYLKITLKDQNGKAIKNAVLTVNIGGAKKHKNTDKNGQIKINVATLTPKTYNAKITYAGSNNYNASTSSVKVTVKKATPKITAKSTSYKLKVKTKKYPVIIKNNKNKALKNTKVTLKVNGKTFNVKTNSKGLGVFKITNLKKKGIYIAVITVPTNKYYNKISKKMKIAVKS